MAATAPKLEYAELTDVEAEIFDAYTAAKAKASKLRQSEKVAKTSKLAIIEAMGTCTVARLPDGRVISRIARSRMMPARKACEESWEDLAVAVPAKE